MKDKWLRDYVKGLEERIKQTEKDVKLGQYVGHYCPKCKANMVSQQGFVITEKFSSRKVFYPCLSEVIRYYREPPKAFQCIACETVTYEEKHTESMYVILGR